MNSCAPSRSVVLVPLLASVVLLKLKIKGLG